MVAEQVSYEGRQGYIRYPWSPVIGGGVGADTLGALGNQVGSLVMGGEGYSRTLVLL